MIEIREFIFSLLIVSVSGATVTMFLPENTKTAKYLHFLVGIVVTSVLLMPLGRLKYILPELVPIEIQFDIKDTDVSVYTSTVISDTCRRIGNELSDLIVERIGVRPSRIEVYSNRDPENLMVNCVKIYFGEKNKLLYSDAYKYTKEILGADCEVNIMYEDP